MWCVRSSTWISQIRRPRPQIDIRHLIGRWFGFWRFIPSIVSDSRPSNTRYGGIRNSRAVTPLHAWVCVQCGCRTHCTFERSGSDSHLPSNCHASVGGLEWCFLEAGVDTVASLTVFTCGPILVPSTGRGPWLPAPIQLVAPFTSVDRPVQRRCGLSGRLQVGLLSGPPTTIRYRSMQFIKGVPFRLKLYRCGRR